MFGEFLGGSWGGGDIFFERITTASWYHEPPENITVRRRDLQRAENRYINSLLHQGYELEFTEEVKRGRRYLVQMRNWGTKSVARCYFHICGN